MSFLLGILGKNSVRITYSKLDAEDSISKIKEECSNGWGVGFYQNRVAYIVKRTVSFYNDERIDKIMDKIRTNAVITHFRSATSGEVKESNTHPFRYGVWLFAHSGTIANFRKIKSLILQRLPESLKEKIVGNTDSEYCFHLFLSYLKGKGYLKKGEIPFDKAVDALQQTSVSLNEWRRKIKPGNYSTYNFLTTNGKYLLATKNGDALFYLKNRWAEDSNIFKIANLRIKIEEDMGDFVVISSEKLCDSEDWVEVKENQLLAVDENINVILQPLKSFMD